MPDARETYIANNLVSRGLVSSERMAEVLEWMAGQSQPPELGAYLTKAAQAGHLSSDVPALVANLNQEFHELARFTAGSAKAPESPRSAAQAGAAETGAAPPVQSAVPMAGPRGWGPAVQKATPVAGGASPLDSPAPATPAPPTPPPAAPPLLEADSEPLPDDEARDDSSAIPMPSVPAPPNMPPAARHLFEDDEATEVEGEDDDGFEDDEATELEDDEGEFEDEEDDEDEPDDEGSALEGSASGVRKRRRRRRRRSAGGRKVRRAGGRRARTTGRRTRRRSSTGGSGTGKAARAPKTPGAPASEPDTPPASPSASPPESPPASSASATSAPAPLTPAGTAPAAPESANSTPAGAAVPGAAPAPIGGPAPEASAAAPADPAQADPARTASAEVRRRRRGRKGSGSGSSARLAAVSTKPRSQSGSSVRRRKSTATLPAISGGGRRKGEEVSLPLIAGIGAGVFGFLLLIMAFVGGGGGGGGSSSTGPVTRRPGGTPRRGPLVSDTLGQGSGGATRGSRGTATGSSGGSSGTGGTGGAAGTGGTGAAPASGELEAIRLRAEHGDLAGALRALDSLPPSPAANALREQLRAQRAQAVRTRLELAEACLRRGEVESARGHLKDAGALGTREDRELIARKLEELEVTAKGLSRAEPIRALVRAGRLEDAWRMLVEVQDREGPMRQLRRQVRETLLRREVGRIMAHARAQRRDAALTGIARLESLRLGLSSVRTNLLRARVERLLSGRSGGGTVVAGGGSTTERQPAGPARTGLTYKDDFHDLKALAVKAGEDEKPGLLKAMAAVMRRSLELVPRSPEMAYDVCAFYHKRRAFIARDPELKQLLEQHHAEAVRTILPSCTGPAGFERLASFCRRVGAREGLATLKPLLAKLKPARAGSALSKSCESARRGRDKTLLEVRRFVRRSKIEFTEELSGLLDWLSARRLRSKAIEAEFETLADRLIRKIGRDPEQAGLLLAALREIPFGGVTPDQREELEGEFAKRVAKLRRDAETRLLKAVNSAIRASEPSVAFDLLRDVLTLDPDSSRAHRGLLMKKVEGQWLRPWDAERRAAGFRYDEAIGWYPGKKREGQVWHPQKKAWEDLAAADRRHADPGNPWILESEHFTLKSTAPMAESQEVLRRLEAFYLQSFRQLDRFFSPRGDPRVIFGLGKMPRHTVTFYNSREQYLAHADPPAKWSAGFWHSGRRSSFFYTMGGTWVVLQHELTHQLLGENAGGHPESWLAEGIAVYVENAFFDDTGRLTLGDLRRHRRPYTYYNDVQRGAVSIRWPEVLALKTNAQWGSGAIADHYKGAGAVVYFLMNFDGGRYRASFLDYLRACYNGGAAGSLFERMGLAESSLEWLFERFYKTGFVAVDGRLLTHEEKAWLDRERIARRYPDPEDREDEPETPVDDGLGELRRAVVKARDEAALRSACDALLAKGDAGRAALERALGEAMDKAAESTLKAVRRKARGLRSKLAEEGLRRRRAALEFIRDTQKYPSANHGAAGQPEVDRRLAALRQVVERPFEVLREVAGPAREGAERLAMLGAARAERLGAANPAADRIAQLAKAVNERLAMDRVPLDAGEAGLRAENARIRKRNAATGKDLDPEELACVQATNDYRELMGLRCLQLSLRLGRAARGHSQEMKELGYFSHQSPTAGRKTPADRCRLEGATYSAENIASGRSTGEGALDGWLHSSGHHRNILGVGHRAIGVGRAGGLWTQVFSAAPTD